MQNILLKKMQWCLIMALLVCQQISAKQTVSKGNVLSGSNLAVNSTFACYTDIMNPYAGTIPTAGFWQRPTGQTLTGMTAKLAMYDVLQSKAAIKLKIKEDQSLVLPNTFSFTVQVSYMTLNYVGGYAGPKTVSLKVNYDKTKGQQYKNLDIFIENNTALLSCSIVSIVGDPVSNTTLSQLVELYAEVEYDYLLKPNFFTQAQTYQIRVNGTEEVPALNLLFAPLMQLKYDDANNTNILVNMSIRNEDNSPLLINYYNEYGFTDPFWRSNAIWDGFNNFNNWVDSVELQWTFTEDEYFKLDFQAFGGWGMKITTIENDASYVSNGHFSVDFKNKYTVSVIIPYKPIANQCIYKIANVFEKGVLAFRARFLGRMAVKNNLSQIIGVKTIECPWSDQLTPTANLSAAKIITVNNNVFTSPIVNSAASYAVAMKVNAFSKKLNWIYDCTYAEDGKKKEVVNYFDGTLKSRQIITTSNTDDFALIKETIYDYQGRPAIEVLPVPTLPNNLRYVPNFNQSVNQVDGSTVAYSARDFDFETSTCGISTLGMAQAAGAAKYYSESNNWLGSDLSITANHQFIPSSGNSTSGYYPFVQTLYTSDNTGRVSSTTQPGAEFRLGNTAKNNTRYFYTKPEQEELDALFGAEVGFASHYTKEAVRDANGQYSISFKNLSGQVIATALAGNNTNATAPLVSSSEYQVVNADLLQHSQTEITDGFLLSSPLFVEKEKTFKFNYSLDAADYTKMCSGSTKYILDCIYNLEISITDECDNEYLEGIAGSTTKASIKRKIGPTAINGTKNASESAYSFSSDDLMQKNTSGLLEVTLPEGNYFITRKITIDKDARENYIQQVVANNLCKQLSEFEDAEMLKIDYSQCHPCDEYKAAVKMKLGEDESAVKAYYIEYVYYLRFENVIHTDAQKEETKALLGQEFDAAKEMCDIKQSTSCDNYKNIILTDVAPGGLYGNTGTSNGIYSVFGTATTPNYTSLDYFATTVVDGKKLIELSLPILLSKWQPIYTLELMPLHPEYYQYKACSNLIASKSFDLNFNNTLDYKGANELKYMDAPSTSPDPIFTLLASNEGVNFTQTINTNAAAELGMVVSKPSGYSLSNKSLKEVVAYTVFCSAAEGQTIGNQTITDEQAVNNCISNTISTLNNLSTSCNKKAENVFWNTYKAFYQALKYKVVYEAYASRIKGTTLNSGNVSNDNIRFEVLDRSNTAMDNAVTKNEAKILSQCQTTCEAMADGWIERLKNCAFNASDLNGIREALISVCKDGCSLKNPFGASSVPASSLNQFRSFEDVLIKYGYQYKTDCNAGLINFPQNYNQLYGNILGTEGPMPFMSLDLCAKDLNPCIMYGNCNQTLEIINTDPTCPLLTNAKSKELLDLMNAVDDNSCATGNCISCSKFKELNQAYYNKGADYTTAYSLKDYINTEIEFNLTEADYNNFFWKCLGYSTKPNDKNDAQILEEYRQAYLIYKPQGASYTYASNSNYHGFWNIPHYFNQTQALASLYIPQSNTIQLLTKSVSSTSIVTSSIDNAPIFIQNTEKGFAGFEQKNSPAIQTASATLSEPKNYQNLSYVSEDACKRMRTFYTDYTNLNPPYAGSFNQYVREVKSITNISNADSILQLCNTIFLSESNGEGAPTESYNGTTPFSQSQRRNLFITAVDLDLTTPKNFGQSEGSGQSEDPWGGPVGDPLPAASSVCIEFVAAINEYWTFKGNAGTLTDYEGMFVSNRTNRLAYSEFIMNQFSRYGKLAAYLITKNIHNAEALAAYFNKMLCDCNLLTNTIITDACPSAANELTPCDRFRNALVAYFHPNNNSNVSITMEELLASANVSKLQGFYNNIKAKNPNSDPWVSAFITNYSTVYAHETPEMLRLWLTDIICNCKIDINYCAENLVKCQADAKPQVYIHEYGLTSIPTAAPRPTLAVNNKCYLPNSKALALQALIQQIASRSVYNCSIPSGLVPIFTSFNIGLADWNLCAPLNSTNLNALFGTITSGNPSALNLDYKATCYNKGNLKELTAEIRLADAVIPNSGYYEVIKKLKLSIILDDPTIYIDFSNVASISDLVPVYLPGLKSETNWFVMKALIKYQVPVKQANGTVLNKVFSKNVLIKGHFEDALTKEVDCNIRCAKLCRTPVVAIDPCEEELKNLAKANAIYNYELYVKNTLEEERRNYTAACLNAIKTKETFTNNYTLYQYHYTLYYYDAAGNLIKTVPPAGVVKLTNIANVNVQRDNAYKNVAINAANLLPAHTLATAYQYNSLNQLQWQQTPDAGESRFGYDKVGRLILSQNAKQKYRTKKSPDNTVIINSFHSYTLYDALGRITEVGEIDNVNLANVYDKADPDDPDQLEMSTFVASEIVADKPKTEITRTYYDRDPSAPLTPNMRGRVAQVAFFSFNPNNTTKPSHAVSYRYDIQGNVKQVIRYIQSLEVLQQANKTVDYDFDIISGKVENVYYQRGKIDQYIHHYKYDAENRLIESYSAPREELIDRTAAKDYKSIGLDASYQYYHHGPLARTELGELKVQGLDYAYTLQGWLKGVNSASLKPIDDMGKDAYTAVSSNIHKNIPADEMGFILNYHNKDYTQIQQSTTSLAYNNQFSGNITTSNTGYSSFAKELYNGNISSMVTAIGVLLSSTNNYGLVSAYQYDQLNRIREAKYYTYNTNNSTLTASNNWNNRFTYDANGNIKTQLRDGAGATTAMDNLVYMYKPNTNQLNYVEDLNTNASNYTDDIDDQKESVIATGKNNYDYDKIGNLIYDRAEEIKEIEWTLYGKIKKITRITGSLKPGLEFEYTPDGHRAVKILIPSDASKPRIYTYYMRDAQGNILATYQREFTKTIDYEVLDYADVNAKLINKAGRAGFASFIAAMHNTEAPLRNSLETNINNNTTYRSAFLNGINLLPLLQANTTFAEATIGAYSDQKWSFLEAIALNKSDYPLALLVNEMAARNTYAATYQTLPITILNDENTLRVFFEALNNQYADAYNSTLQELGIQLTGDINTELDALVAGAQAIDMLQALENHTDIGYLELNNQMFDMINDLLYNNEDFRNRLLGIIPDFQRLFSAYLNGSGGYTSAYQLSTANTIAALNYYDATMLNTKARQNISVAEESTAVTWYKVNQSTAFTNQAVLVYANPVADFQAATPTLYNNPAVGKGIKTYFTHIKTFYGQSIVDQMISEYLPLEGQNLYLDELRVSEWHIYGSSRLGIYKANVLVANKEVHIPNTNNNVNNGNVSASEYFSTPINALVSPVLSVSSFEQMRGAKNYELSNHLGNVLVTVSDKKSNTINTEIYNSDFATGTGTFTAGWSEVGSGWPGFTGPYSVVSNDNGRLKTTATVGYGGNRCVVNTIVGKSYTFTFDLDMGTTTSLNVSARATNGGSPYTGTTFFPILPINTSGKKTFTFTAMTTTTQLLFEKAGGNVATYFYIDNAKVEESIPTALNYYVADVVTANDYSAFGAPLATRTYTAPNSSYRFGFNGQEKDDEVSGAGNTMSATFWEYDARSGRRWNIDPVVKPWASRYSCFSNSPICNVDVNGDDDYYNEKGHFLGTFGENNGKLQLINNKDFSAIKNKVNPDKNRFPKKIPPALLLAKSKEIKVQSVEEQQKVMASLEALTAADGKEARAVIILDVSNAELKMVIDPTAIRNEHNIQNKYKYKSDDPETHYVPENQLTKVIIGDVHTHPDPAPGMVRDPGPSTPENCYDPKFVDTNTSQKNKANGYVLDQGGLYKATPSGGTATLDKSQTNVVKDAIQTYGQTH